MDDRCQHCKHYSDDQSEYHYCHICCMEYDCYEQKEENKTKAECVSNYDRVAACVKAYWQQFFPQDVVAFFFQKYIYETDWEPCEEVVFCESPNDYDSVTFLNDFCEGQTCIKDIVIVPLSEVVEHYRCTKLSYSM